MRKRRILSLLTALALCLSLLPVTALAVGTECDGTNCNHVAAIGNIHYDSLADAIAAVPTNGTETTIKVLKADHYWAAQPIQEGQNIRLDLNENRVIVNSGIAVAEQKYATIVNHGTLTVVGGTLYDYGDIGDGYTATDFFIDNTGILNVENDCTIEGFIVAVHNDGGTVISSGTIKCSYEYGKAIETKSGTINITGGQVQGYMDASKGIEITGGSMVTISGGTIDNCATAIEMGRGTLNISGGTFDGTEYSLNQTVTSNTQVNITGGTFEDVKLQAPSTLENCAINGNLDLNGDTEHEISGVTFGENATVTSNRYYVENGTIAERTSYLIKIAAADSTMGNFHRDSYNFGYTSGSGGSYDLQEWSVYAGSTVKVQVTAHPKSDYVFVGWYNDQAGTGTLLTTEPQLTLEISAEEGGLSENISCYAIFKTSDEYNDMVEAANTWISGYDSGTKNFSIADKDDMQSFAYAVNYLGKDFSGKTVTLDADLAYTDTDSFTPIGTAAHPFKGTFDGGNHTITGLSAVGTYDTDVAGSYLGLFGYTSGAKIQDLTLSGVDFNGAYMAGGFAGEANSTTFTNCTLTGGSKVSSAYFTGGLFGHSSGGCTVTGCKVEYSVLDGKWKTGGITGYADGVTISDTAVNNTEVKGIGVGALIGHANAGNTALTNVTVADVTDGEQKKINVIGTTYEGGDSHSITVSGDSTNMDAAGLVPSGSTSNVQVDGGDFTFVIPDQYVSGNTGKISVTFKNGEEIVIVHVIARGGTVTLPAAPTKDNYIFKGWYVGVTKITGETTFTDNTVVNAQWYEIPVSSGGVTPPTHDISVDSGSHGDVEVWPQEAKQGTTVTITATPDKGYEVAEVVVTAENGKEITVTDKGNNKYTFMMPGSDVTIEVTFQPVSGGSTSGDLTITAPAGWVNPYTDVAANAWYYDAVGYATANGLMGGVGSNAFDPSGSMNRAMVWTVIARLAGQTISGSTWAEDARTWAMAQGVSDGTNPDGAVSREELVTMLYRYAGSPAMNVPELALIGNYPDSADVSAWAQNAFAWAISKGIIEGRDGKLAAGEVLTRAEAATILARFHLLTK